MSCAPVRSTAVPSAWTCTPAERRRPARPTSASSPWPHGGTPRTFTEAERAALALTEAGTRLADRADPVPDAVFDEAAKHYDGQALAALVVCIAAINTWNRLNVITGQEAGEWTTQWVS